MAMDAYSMALQSRRGKSLDPHMAMMSSDQLASIQEAAHSPTDHANVDSRLGIDQIPPEVKDTTQGTKVAHGDGKAQASPPDLQLAGAGAAQPGQDEIRDHVIGHESPNEYDQMKNQKPRSLGERAKLVAMKDKYDVKKD